jgi:hypothetical protein
MNMGMAMVTKTRVPRNSGHGSISRLTGPRSGRERLSIALLLILGTAAFAITVQVSVAGVFRNKRPQLALLVAPSDATARSRLASQLVAHEEARDISRALAKDAIARDPLQPIAFRVLSESFGGQNSSVTTSRELMDESARLSRRELPTQMWFIEQFGRTGEAELMLQHFDIALRTSESAWGTGFPMLALAASDAEGEELVFKTISARPVWAPEFARYMMGSGANLPFTMRVAELLLDPANPDNRGHYLLLLRRLTENGFLAQAWELYGRLGFVGADATTKLVRNGDFERAEDGTPFDWVYAQAPELWAARERLNGKQGGFVLSLAAYNGRSGEVASQLIRLPQGSHRFRVKMGDVPADRYDRPELLLTCAGRKGSDLLSIRSDSPGSGPQDVDERFVVPQDCPFQRIVIRKAGSGPLRYPHPWIDNIVID